MRKKRREILSLSSGEGRFCDNNGQIQIWGLRAYVLLLVHFKRNSLGMVEGVLGRDWSGYFHLQTNAPSLCWKRSKRLQEMRRTFRGAPILSQSHPLQQPGPLGFPGMVAPDIFCTKTFGGAGWWGTHCSIRLGCPLNPWGSTHDCYIFHHLHFFLENQQDVSGEHTASKAGSYFHIFGSHCSHLPTISFSTSDPWVFKFLSARWIIISSRIFSSHAQKRVPARFAMMKNRFLDKLHKNQL